MSLKHAIDTLVAVTVTGVTKSYTLEEIRRGVPKPHLPALLPLPNEGTFTPASYGYGPKTFVSEDIIRHRLLVRPADTSLQGEAMAATVELIDTYRAALQNLSSHAGLTELRPQSYASGIVQWQGVDYYGADFLILARTQE
jgi:hypothetical protein